MCPLVVVAKMPDPDRCINQDHAGLERHIGTSAKSGWEPPSRAKRRALSRAINA
jgi:hypothetical protein